MCLLLRPVITPFTGFPLRRPLRLAGQRWRYSNPLATWRARSPYIPQEQDGPVKSHVTADSQSIIMPWSPVHVALEAFVSTNFNLTLAGIHEGKIFNVTIRRAACPACSSTWNFGANSVFALGPRKTLIELTFWMQADFKRAVRH
jgi:hypothetical protein